MREYVCADCGYQDGFEDFSQGCCPCCGCDDVYIVDREAEFRPEFRSDYDLDQYLDLGESPFDLGDC